MAQARRGFRLLYLCIRCRSFDGRAFAFISWGNDGIARHIVKTLIPTHSGPNALEAVCRNSIDFQELDRPGQPSRIRLASTTVWVKHEGDPSKSNFVTIVYTRATKFIAESTFGGDGRRVLDFKVDCARSAFNPSPSLRSVLSFALHDGECRSAKLALPYKLGISGCQWFEGLGGFTRSGTYQHFPRTRKPLGRIRQWFSR